MSNLLMGEAFDIGGGESYDDRYGITEIITRGGLTLRVAILADGTGGKQRGARAAQLAVDIMIEAIGKSIQTNILELLTLAFDEVNLAIYQEAHYSKLRMEASLAVVIIDQANRLYIANVGTNHIYLSRGGGLTQINGEGSIDYRLKSASFGEIEDTTRVGASPSITPSTSIYIDVQDDAQAQQIGTRGFVLQQGDTVLVVSDSLVKKSSMGHPYVRQKEIINVLNSKSGHIAAQTLISLARSRNVNEDVTVLLMQLDRVVLSRKATMGSLVGMALTLILMLAIFAGGKLIYTASDPTNTVVSIVITTTPRPSLTASLPPTHTPSATMTASLTNTPTPVPTATLLPGQAGQLRVFNPKGSINISEPDSVKLVSVASSKAMVLRERTLIQTGENTPLQIVLQQNASILLFPSSEVNIVKAVSPNSQLPIEAALKTGQLFINTGNWSKGGKITAKAYNLQAEVTGSCMGVAIEPEKHTVAAYCFSGVCKITSNDDTRLLSPGKQVVYKMLDHGLDVGQVSVIDQSRLVDYSLGSQFTDMDCVQTLITPTPTSTPTLTFTPTNTLIPPATSTMAYTETPYVITVMPTKVTPIPPTAIPPTSVPPTAVPPTDEPPTTVPPTGIPPTDEPPTSEPPTAMLPTDEPPTSIPPTSIPPTNEPPTSEPPTAVPPTDELASSTG